MLCEFLILFFIFLMTNMKLDKKGRKHTKSTSTRSIEVQDHHKTKIKQPKAKTKSNMEKTSSQEQPNSSTCMYLLLFSACNLVWIFSSVIFNYCLDWHLKTMPHLEDCCVYMHLISLDMKIFWFFYFDNRCRATIFGIKNRRRHYYFGFRKENDEWFQGTEVLG